MAKHFLTRLLKGTILVNMSRPQHNHLHLQTLTKLFMNLMISDSNQRNSPSQLDLCPQQPLPCPASHIHPLGQSLEHPKHLFHWARSHLESDVKPGSGHCKPYLKASRHMCAILFQVVGLAFRAETHGLFQALLMMWLSAAERAGSGLHIPTVHRFDSPAQRVTRRLRRNIRTWAKHEAKACNGM